MRLHGVCNSHASSIAHSLWESAASSLPSVGVQPQWAVSVPLPCLSAACTGKGSSPTEEGIGKASKDPDMCCGIFNSAESSSHPFVCVWRHAQTLPMRQIPNVFKRVSVSFGFLLSVCGPFGTDSFLRGDKGQFKIFRCTM